MPTYVAFLRAINLGPTRQFPKASIKAATEAAGATDVETYINTGNVRLTTSLRSRAKLEAALEKAYAADRGFDVPTIVFTVAELKQIAQDAEVIAAHVDLEPPTGPSTGPQTGPPIERRHYVSLLKDEPTTESAALIETLSTDQDRAIVKGRAVHLLLQTAYHSTPLGNAHVEKVLGVATNRNLTVVRALATRWG